MKRIEPQAGPITPGAPTRRVARTGGIARAGSLALLLATLAACDRGADPVSGGELRDLPADQIMYNAQYDIKDVGVLRARLLADSAYVWEDSAKSLMFTVDLSLFDSDGGPTAHLTSVEGELDTRTNRMVARGNVVLVTTEGDRRILTEELHYDPRTGRIWSDVHTVVHEDETTLEGEGFSADDEMEVVEVRQGTGANIRIDF